MPAIGIQPVADACTPLMTWGTRAPRNSLAAPGRPCHIQRAPSKQALSLAPSRRIGAVPVRRSPPHTPKERHSSCTRCSAFSSAAAAPFPEQESSPEENTGPKSPSGSWLAAIAGRVGPQATVYSLCAAATCVWWLWTLNHGVAAGALFASATVAAQQGTMVLAIKSAWAGLLAGCLHTLAGADHLAALTPLTIGRSRANSAVLGALWGAGHSTGQLFLGLLMVLLKDRFNALMPALTKWGGTMVGLTLLAIGFMGIYEAYFEKHEEEDDGSDELAAIDEKAKGGKSFAFATYATGIVYGLQPDALFVVIPALALPTKAAAAAYIIMFVIGTCAAMGSYTALIGHTTEAIGEKNPWVTQNLTLLASIVAIVIGLLILLPGWGVSIPFSPF